MSDSTSPAIADGLLAFVDVDEVPGRRAVGVVDAEWEEGDVGVDVPEEEDDDEESPLLLSEAHIWMRALISVAILSLLI
ncbi:hypothetical protein HDU97_000896 [Phlyctochytrium planicorne]|nr:hypothetical protein HDU97_000884 [Phlyctochytrium planicorne]KAJ3102053.1 hypothetical protein HDU97_000896 [Phlyctochytrium planicorne]